MNESKGFRRWISYGKLATINAYRLACYIRKPRIYPTNETGSDAKNSSGPTRRAKTIVQLPVVESERVNEHAQAAATAAEQHNAARRNVGNVHVPFVRSYTRLSPPIHFSVYSKTVYSKQFTTIAGSYTSVHPRMFM